MNILFLNFFSNHEMSQPGALPSATQTLTVFKISKSTRQRISRDSSVPRPRGVYVCPSREHVNPKKH